MASVGSYLSINRGTGRSARKYDFRFQGGNFIAPATFLRRIGVIVGFIRNFVPDPDCARSLSEDFLSFFSDIDVDLNDPLAMQHHYLHIRSRFHHGRDWLPRGMRTVTPLIDRSLAELFLRDVTLQRRFYCDMLLAIDKELALLPFDNPKKKALNPEMLMQSPFFQKPVRMNADRVPDITPYFGEVEGEPEDCVQSFKKVFTQMYYEFEAAGMETKLFDKAFQDAAQREIVSGRALHRDFRRSAHLLSAGMLLEALS